MEWKLNSYYKYSIKNLFNYFSILSVSFHDINSLFGFFIFLTIFSQIISGIMLSFSLIPECMLIPMVREEEDTEDLYIDDFFWLHERGVDLIFLFCYFHFFRKLYLNVFEYENESAWKSGVFTFLIFHVVVFAGLVLCCTHLSEITLTIAANILHTICLSVGKIYWWIFTDKQLNTDTLIRLAYLHYLSAFYMAYLGLIHGVEMHYDWKNEASFDGLQTEMIWWDEAFSNELSSYMDVLFFITVVFWFLFSEPEALSYEIFMWGDVGLVVDVRFYGVAPHWYFRPFMAWLIACPFSIIGIYGLLLYMMLLFFQPFLHGTSELMFYSKKTIIIYWQKFKKFSFFNSKQVNVELNVFYQFSYILFICACLYSSSFLPFGRFYNRLGGNIGLLVAYINIFFYLTFTNFRKFIILELFLEYLYTQLNFLEKHNIYLLQKKQNIILSKLLLVSN